MVILILNTDAVGTDTFILLYWMLSTEIKINVIRNFGQGPMDVAASAQRVGGGRTEGQAGQVTRARSEGQPGQGARARARAEGQAEQGARARAEGEPGQVARARPEGQPGQGARARTEGEPGQVARARAEGEPGLEVNKETAPGGERSRMSETGTYHSLKGKEEKKTTKGGQSVKNKGQCERAEKDAEKEDSESISPFSDVNQGKQAISYQEKTRTVRLVGTGRPSSSSGISFCETANRVEMVGAADDSER